MEYWYRMDLGESTMAMEALDALRSQFAVVYEQNGRPEGMALFVRHLSEGRLHCEAVVYFSPMASGMADASRVRPCARPSRGGLGLLAGASEAWDVLF